MKEQQEEFAKREQKYTDYIGKLEAKLVQQAKMMQFWTKAQQKEYNTNDSRNDGQANEELTQKNSQHLPNNADIININNKKSISNQNNLPVGSRTLSPPPIGIGSRPRSANNPNDKAPTMEEMLLAQNQDTFEQVLQLQRKHITGLAEVKIANLKDALAKLLKQNREL